MKVKLNALIISTFLNKKVEGIVVFKLWQKVLGISKINELGIAILEIDEEELEKGMNVIDVFYTGNKNTKASKTRIMKII